MWEEAGCQMERERPAVQVPQIWFTAAGIRQEAVPWHGCVSERKEANTYWPFLIKPVMFLFVVLCRLCCKLLHLQHSKRRAFSSMWDKEYCCSWFKSK